MSYRPVLLALIAIGNTACASGSGSVVLPEPGSGVYGHLRLESSEPGPVLYQQVGRLSPTNSPRSLEQLHPAYAPLCALPCEVDVDVGPALYVEGKGITRSDFFQLDPSRGPVTFVVEPGSSTRYDLSAIGLVGGVLIFTAGGLTANAGHWWEPPLKLETPGLVLMGVGLAGLFAGALLFPGSQTTLKPKKPFSLAHP